MDLCCIASSSQSKIHCLLQDTFHNSCHSELVSHTCFIHLSIENGWSISTYRVGCNSYIGLSVCRGIVLRDRGGQAELITRNSNIRFLPPYSCFTRFPWLINFLFSLERHVVSSLGQIRRQRLVQHTYSGSQRTAFRFHLIILRLRIWGTWDRIRRVSRVV